MHAKLRMKVMKYSHQINRNVKLAGVVILISGSIRFRQNLVHIYTSINSFLSLWLLFAYIYANTLNAPCSGHYCYLYMILVLTNCMETISETHNCSKWRESLIMECVAPIKFIYKAAPAHKAQLTLMRVGKKIVRAGGTKNLMWNGSRGTLPMIPEQSGCLSKTWSRTTPIDILKGEEETSWGFIPKQRI